MKIKNQSVKIKAGPGDGLAEGQFTAYASVFGNKDSYGDVVMPGAFADSLTEWEASTSPIPLLFGHNGYDPDFNIGHITDAVEDDHGLLLTGQLDLESPKAMQTYRLLKGKRVDQMSFAYDVLDAGHATSEALGDYFELRKLKLYEISVVSLGANQETEVLAIKSAVEALTADGVKAGCVLAAKHIDSLRSAQEAIGAAIAASEADQEKASASGTATTQEPSGATVQEPSPDVSVDDLAATIRIKILEGVTQ